MRAARLCSWATRCSIRSHIRWAARRICQRFQARDWAARLKWSSSLAQSFCIRKQPPSPILPTKSAQFQARNAHKPGSKANRHARGGRQLLVIGYAQAVLAVLQRHAADVPLLDGGQMSGHLHIAEPGMVDAAAGYTVGLHRKGLPRVLT